MSEQEFITPSATDIELLVIGAILSDSAGLEKILNILTPEMFFNPINKSVFETIVKHDSIGDGFDIFSISQELKTELEPHGGLLYLLDASERISSSARIREHALIVREKFILRKMTTKFRRVTARIGAGDDTNEILSETNSMIDEINSLVSGVNGNMEHIAIITERALEAAAARQQAYERGESAAISTGLRGLDYKITGLSGSELILLAGRPGSGKGLLLDELVLTDHGWVQNKDLKIGDNVASIDGAESRVTGIYPLGEIDFYKVKFSDGREIECCGDHLWEVTSYKFSGDPVRVLNTKQIQEKLTRVRYRNRMSIPLFSGNYGIEKNFLVHPYVLGVLLGDGCLTCGLVYSKNDQDVNLEVERCIDGKVLVHRTKDRGDINRIKINGGNKEYIQELKRLGVWGKRSWEKFIPTEYFHASREQRLALLNGLLDTDGDVCMNGSSSFSSTSLQLAKDTQKLAWSLGYKCTLGEKQGRVDGVDKRMSYRLYIANGRTESELFTLPRKKDRLRTDRTTKPLMILSVDYVGKKEGQCISVSHPRALYITKDYLVTHNTAMMLHLALSSAKKGIPVCIYSLEMSDISLANRLLLTLSGISSDRFRRGILDREDWIKLGRAEQELSKLPIYIDANAAVTMGYIRAHSKIMKKKGKCGVIMVDYLQLADMSTVRSSSNREQEVSEASRQAKLIAKELDVPVIVLSQLSRKVEERTDKIPIMSDLRESGGLEANADVILFMYRPEYYGITELNTSQYGTINTKGVGMISVAKQREGATGAVLFKYNENLSKFRDYEDSEFA